MQWHYHWSVISYSVSHKCFSMLIGILLSQCKCAISNLYPVWDARVEDIGMSLVMKCWCRKVRLVGKQFYFLIELKYSCSLLFVPKLWMVNNLISGISLKSSIICKWIIRRVTCYSGIFMIYYWTCNQWRIYPSYQYVIRQPYRNDLGLIPYWGDNIFTYPEIKHDSVVIQYSW
jgi:hypothetical protein